MQGKGVWEQKTGYVDGAGDTLEKAKANAKDKYKSIKKNAPENTKDYGILFSWRSGRSSEGGYAASAMYHFKQWQPKAERESKRSGYHR